MVPVTMTCAMSLSGYARVSWGDFHQITTWQPLQVDL